MAEDETPRDVSGLTARRFLRLKSKDKTKPAYYGRKAHLRDPDELPRVIHMFWDKGFDNAPEIARLCLKSWQINNPGWRFNLLDADSAREVVDIDSFPSRPGMPGYSDLLRVRLLDRFGGVWADASVLCLRPLDVWLPWMFTQTGFFAFRQPGADRVLSSWLLASVPGHPLIRGWRDLGAEFWGEPMSVTPPYFWSHYLFEYLIRSSKRHKHIWNRVPQLSAGPEHQLMLHFMGLKEAESVLPMLRSTPVQKLTQKKPIDMDRLAAMLGETHPELAAQLFAA